MINYNKDEIRRVKYLLRRISELQNGHALSAQFTKGYPFCTYVNRFGEKTLNRAELENNEIFNFLKDYPNISDKVDLIEIAWQHYLVYGTPNGDLFKVNNLFDSIEKGKGLTLLHCTGNLAKIKESGLLFPSGGCLGASLYCVPLRSDNRIHNLTEFMIQEEIPKASLSTGKDSNSAIIAIQIQSENFIHSNQESNALDYLLMGKMQAELYFKFKEEINIEISHFEKIECEAISQINKSIEFLNLCVDYKLNNHSNNYFIDLFENALGNIDTLGYMYFEVLVEYITLFQDDEISLKYKERGEMYNMHYKQMIFDLSPNLYSGFKLVNFKPSVAEIVYYLKTKAKKGLIFNNFLEDHFINFFKWRIGQYVRLKLMDKHKIDYEATLKNLFSYNPSIIGHMLHRSIRVSEKLKSHTSLYDESRAKAIWSLWNKENVLFPYNCIVPKGEVGINPNFPNLEYSVFEVIIDPKTDEIVFTVELDVKLAFELINKNLSLLRAPQ